MVSCSSESFLNISVISKPSVVLPVEISDVRVRDLHRGEAEPGDLSFGVRSSHADCEAVEADGTRKGGSEVDLFDDVVAGRSAGIVLCALPKAELHAKLSATTVFGPLLARKCLVDPIAGHQRAK